jgi:alanyl-tRNA synthetase
MAENKRVSGFKKFSDMRTGKVEEVNPSTELSASLDLPMNPNLPNKSKKVERPISRPIPKDQNLEVNTDKDNFENDINLDDKKNEAKVETFGKVAKFPKNVKASKAYNFLENVKVSKKSIWYIMIEKDNELQMVKYNYKEGVDLSKFVNELKTFYIAKNKGNKSICEAISKIAVDGNDKYSMIRNIPLVEVDGRKMISKITEDLIKLLSK